MPLDSLLPVLHQDSLLPVHHLDSLLPVHHLDSLLPVYLDSLLQALQSKCLAQFLVNLQVLFQHLMSVQVEV